MVWIKAVVEGAIFFLNLALICFLIVVLFAP